MDEMELEDLPMVDDLEIAALAAGPSDLEDSSEEVKFQSCSLYGQTYFMYSTVLGHQDISRVCFHTLRASTIYIGWQSFAYLAIIGRMLLSDIVFELNKDSSDSEATSSPDNSDDESMPSKENGLMSTKSQQNVKLKLQEQGMPILSASQWILWVSLVSSVSFLRTNECLNACRPILGRLLSSGIEQVSLHVLALSDYEKMCLKQTQKKRRENV